MEEIRKKEPFNVGYIENRSMPSESRVDGRLLKRKTVGDDKVYNVSSAIADNSVSKAKMLDDSVGKNELDTEEVAVTVSAGNPSGTGTCTSGSIIIGFRPSGNNDQFVDNIAVSGTTVTVTLAANATADNTFVVILLKT